MSIFFAPHNDDEALFGAFTLQREKPLVVVVFDGHVQERRGLPVSWTERRAETARACGILRCEGLCFLGFSDADPDVSADDIRRQATEVLGVGWGRDPDEKIFAPAYEVDGHPQHNLVSKAILHFDTTRYLTYTSRGKSTSARPVAIERAEWIERKLQALACYRSQFNLDPRMGCYPHFLRDQTEYYQ